MKLVLELLLGLVSGLIIFYLGYFTHKFTHAHNRHKRGPVGRDYQSEQIKGRDDV